MMSSPSRRTDGALVEIGDQRRESRRGTARADVLRRIERVDDEHRTASVGGDGSAAGLPPVPSTTRDAVGVGREAVDARIIERGDTVEFGDAAGEDRIEENLRTLAHAFRCPRRPALGIGC